jgi:dTDP-4-amino-4,6-dideoxygalactose transaminase
MNQNPKENNIPFTKPSLPPVEEFIPYLENIWKSGQLTNGGNYHQQFEKALCEHLGVKFISLFGNGTLALMMALRALDLQGEVITSPFTWVATSQAIVWNNLKPVFVDINETNFNITTVNIEKAITPGTCAIVPVHIFGNPCDMAGIEKIAKKYHLKVIYDAAHCFGVTLNGTSVCNFGDLTILSFHATKSFHSFEGGAVVCHDKKMKDKLDALRNNGLSPDTSLMGFGLNAKMNEMQAAFGLLQLKYVDEAISNRKKAADKYRKLLENINGIYLQKQEQGIEYNYTYFPVLIDRDKFGISRDELVEVLIKNDIFSKTYFYPLVSSYELFSKFKKHSLQVAEKVASNIICLPLYAEMEDAEILKVAKTINNSKK